MEETAITEAEWLAATDPTLMLRTIKGKSSVRKFRLCAAACCRRIDYLLIPTQLARGAVVLAERMADRLKVSPTLPEFRDRLLLNGFAWIDGVRRERQNNAYAHAVWAASDALEDDDSFLGLAPPGNYDLSPLTNAAADAAWAVAHWRRRNDEDPVKAEEHQRESAEQVTLVHDVFGNPFGSARAPDPGRLSWQGGTVSQLARSAYEERQLPEGMLYPERLALLADALEDAGCTDAELLGHLRSAGPHVRGCWAVDLLLSKQ